MSYQLPSSFMISIYSLLHTKLLQINLKSRAKSTKKMKYNIYSSCTFLIISIFLVSNWLSIEAQTCSQSGKVVGVNPPKKKCNRENRSECCKKGKNYPVFECSPPVSKHTKATLTLNSFQKGGDGGGPSECDGKYHSDKTPVVALSTGWFNKSKRCSQHITIHGNGRSVKAKVVDECDSTEGCDPDHDYQPPCHNNIVDASKAVWKALGIKQSDSRWGEMTIFWSDA